jgi:hypothetical protein
MEENSTWLCPVSRRAVTPREIVARLSAEVTRILRSEELRETLAAQGAGGQCIGRRRSIGIYAYHSESGNARESFMAHQVTVKEQVANPKRVREAGRSSKRPLSRFAAVRGTATVKLRAEEILALTRGKD